MIIHIFSTHISFVCFCFHTNDKKKTPNIWRSRNKLMSLVQPHPHWTTQPQMTRPIQILPCVKLSCLVHLPPSPDLPLFLPDGYPNRLRLLSPWHEKSHTPNFACSFWPPLSLFLCLSLAFFETKILSFFLSLDRVIFWLLVWSHCKYFQDEITVSKSLRSLPGGDAEFPSRVLTWSVFSKYYCC